MARCSRSWKSVHGRGEGGGRLEIDRKADRVALGLFVLGSEVDAEREDLHVEAEAADRAAGEQFKRPGARADARTVGGRARVPQTAETTLTRSPRGLSGSRALRLGLAIRPRVPVPPPPRKRPPSASSYPHTAVHQQRIHAAASVLRARAQAKIRLAPRFIGPAAPIRHVVHDTALFPASLWPQAASISREFVRWGPASFPCALGLGVLLQPALVVHDSSDEIGRSEGATNRRTRHTCQQQYAHGNAEARRLHQSRFMSYGIS